MYVYKTAVKSDPRALNEILRNLQDDSQQLKPYDLMLFHIKYITYLSHLK